MKLNMTRLDVQFAIDALTNTNNLTKEDAKRRDRIVRNFELALQNLEMESSNRDRLLDLLDKVSEGLFDEFTEADESGEVIMLDYNSVIAWAKKKNHRLLASMSLDVYIDIISFYHILKAYYVG